MCVGRRQPFAVADAVDQEAQPVRCSGPRVEQADGAGRHVARVGEDRFAARLLPLVERHQVGVGHVDFAADFQHRRMVAGQAQRHAERRADGVRDVVAHLPVAARHAAHEHAVFVEDRHGHAVDLQLDDPFDRLARQPLAAPLRKRADSPQDVGVLDREHRQAMRDLSQFGNRLIADPLRRAVGRDQFRMLLLELLELGQQPVVLEVGDLRRRFDVVLAVVVANFVAQKLDPLRVLSAHARDCRQIFARQQAARRQSNPGPAPTAGAISPLLPRRTAAPRSRPFQWPIPLARRAPPIPRPGSSIPSDSSLPSAPCRPADEDRVPAPS